MGLFSSLFGSGNSSAYDTSGLADAVNKSNDLYKQVYGDSTAAGAPFVQSGTAANSMLANFLGLSGDSSAPGYASLTTSLTPTAYAASDPSYQFLQDEAQKAVERSASAKGSIYAPSTMTALQDRAAQVASTGFNDAFTRDMQSKASIYDMLNGVSGAGQNQIGINAGLGANYADSISNNNIGLQNSILGAYQAKNANTQSMLSNWMGVGAKVGAAAAAASDRRVKDNIKLVGRKNGFNVYHFTYKGGSKRYEGVMAQEVAETRPDAVVNIGGILHVNYGRIGMEMREV
jgi:hypothetical protein